jgi:hypothetical protein
MASNQGSKGAFSGNKNSCGASKRSVVRDYWVDLVALIGIMRAKHETDYVTL